MLATSSVLVTLLTGWIAATAAPVVVRHDVPDEAYVALVRDPAFAAVGAMHAGGSVRGTGTLIDAEWVLTAAHVADDAPAAAWTFVVGGALHAAAEIIVHEDWSGVATGGSDLALVRLERPVVGIEPLSLFDGDDRFDTPVTLLGFGWTGDGAVGATHGDDRLCAATNAIEGRFVDYMVLFFDEPGSGDETEFEGISAFRGSGGPVLVETDDGWQLAGVNAFILDWNDNGVMADYGDAHGATRIVLHDTWIDAVRRGCPADLDGDGAVGAGDLLAVLLSTGPCADCRATAHCPACGADLDANGAVDFGDVLAILTAWGPCR